MLSEVGLDNVCPRSRYAHEAEPVFMSSCFSGLHFRFVLMRRAFLSARFAHTFVVELGLVHQIIGYVKGG